MDRIQAASSFILQSPPGEINDVLNGGSATHFLAPVLSNALSVDVRNIISDDDSLQEGLLPALVEYNLAQFMTVEVPGTDHQVHPY
jgi:capping protein alpha